MTILGLLLLFASLAAGFCGVIRVARLDARRREIRAKTEGVLFAAVFIGALVLAIRCLTGGWPWN